MQNVYLLSDLNCCILIGILNAQQQCRPAQWGQVVIYGSLPIYRDSERPATMSACSVSTGRYLRISSHLSGFWTPSNNVGLLSEDRSLFTDLFPFNGILNAQQSCRPVQWGQVVIYVSLPISFKSLFQWPTPFPFSWLLQNWNKFTHCGCEYSLDIKLMCSCGYNWSDKLI